jgi:hypothetical protein
VFFFVLTGIVVFLAVSPLVLMMLKEEPVEVIASGIGWMCLMALPALGSFWLGWRRWSVSKELKQNYEHQQINAEADHQPSADLVSQRADSAAEQHGDREQRSGLNRTGDDHVASGKRSQRHEDGHREHPR